MDIRTPPADEAASLTRSERKALTREALIAGALRRLEDQSFSGLSLREVAREAGITPTAFYRHFGGLEDLGDALVDDAFRALRGMAREMRTGPPAEALSVRRRLEILDRHVLAERDRFRFVARERAGGTRSLRVAIRVELDRLAGELAVDLARIPALAGHDTEHLRTVAGLLISAMSAIIEVLVDVPTGSPAVREELLTRGRGELRLILLGAVGWRTAEG